MLSSPGPGSFPSIAGVAEASGGTWMLRTKTSRVPSRENAGLLSPNKTDGSVLNRDPSWSPDGTQIVFTQDNPDMFKGPKINGDFAPGPGPGLFVVDADGGNLHQLAPTAWAPVWSPDGTSIVFGVGSYKDLVPVRGKGNGYTLTPTSDIFTIRPDGADLRQLTSDGASGGPAWTSDGRIWFALRGLNVPQQPRIMDADGGHVRQLSFPPMLLTAIPNQSAITALTQP
jgi:Tol biopolymer transport system component